MIGRANGHEQPRVLVVEDDDAIVRVLRLSLRTSGFDTAQAESGGEALDAMESDAFDAVVLDLCLPDGRGGDVLRRLQVGGCRPPWVAMSALDEDEAIRRYGPLRGPFLPKPFNPMELVELLDDLLGRGRGESHGNRQLGTAAV
jgi:DNA-binding response OmpR family regulator